MVPVPDPIPVRVSLYGTRARPHTCAGISIQVIHMYLDTHGYSWVPMDFLINFFVQRKIFFNYLQSTGIIKSVSVPIK